MATVAPRELVASKTVNSIRLPTVEDGSTSSASELGRPMLSRRETEQILDYYQSEDAGRAYVSPQSYTSDSSRAASDRELSATSALPTLRPRSAGRDANGDGPVGRTSMESVASSSGGVQRRTSQRSAGGADKRRMAIVEMDSKRDSMSTSSMFQRGNGSGSSPHPLPDHSLFARRGLDSSRLDGLALMAPPDAESSNYNTGLSPVPASAPATGVTPIGRLAKAEPPPSGHQRSLSEVQSYKKGSLGTKASPRDVGIVGTLETMLASSPSPEQVDHPQFEPQRPSTADGDHRRTEDRSGSLTAPVFQTPKSRSPSPLPATEDIPSSQTAADESSLSARGWTVGPASPLTPSIGQEKEIGRPVAGPVVLDVSSGHPVVRRSPYVTPSGLPSVDPQISEPHPYGERETPRTGRLPFKPNQPALSYLHYQPGIHSTAGPLPSPPRHILTQPNSSPPPRPPRLLSPPPTNRRTDSDQSKKSIRLPYADGPKTVPITSLRPPFPVSRGDSDFSIAAVSVSSSGSDTKSPEKSHRTSEDIERFSKISDLQDPQEKKSAASSRSGSHVREGAFPASSVFLSHPSQCPPPRSQHHTLDEVVVAAAGEVVDEEDPLSSSDLSPPTVVEPTRLLKRSHSRPNLRRESSWVSVSAESITGRDDTSPPSSYPSSREGSTQFSTTNLVSDDGHADRRVSLPAPSEQRRFHSLPRTPSILSSGFTRSQTSSPSSLPRKAPSSWPEAMNFQDVLAKKTAAERASAYAAKIRELASEETGLRDWLALNIRKDRREAPASVAMPAINAASRAFSKQSRHVSRGSMASEVTFPIRSDSYTATDLSLRPTTDMSSPTLIPSSLPYPSLAHGVGIRKRSSRSFTTTTDSSSHGLSTPTSPSRSLGGAFFASIGRKASMKKDRPFPVTSHTKLIPSRQSAPVPQPRPVKIGAPPTIPGGPRAPARSVQRATSVLPAPTQNSRADEQGPATPPTMESAESFDQQVEKLSDLLPQADKEVLADYLRRYKQDSMLAIGAYLEDEKQGSLRRD